MYKNIFDLLWMFGIGGWVTAIGGFVGYYIGLKIQEAQGLCFNNCTDPWMYAGIGLVPGILLGISEWIGKKLDNKGL